MFSRVLWIVATGAALASCAGSSDDAGLTTTTAAVRVVTVTDRNHVDADLEYPDAPPVGGDHNPAWQNCGVYSEPVLDETAVHSLEHGAVWISYRPDLDAADVAALEGFASGQTHILVAPYLDLVHPIVLTAWGAQQSFDGIDDEGIGSFIRAFQRGPQTPEPGAVCSRGVGEPE